MKRTFLLFCGRIIIILAFLVQSTGLISFAESGGQENPSGTLRKGEKKEPTAVEIVESKVITLSHGEKVYYKAGKVEKIEIEGVIANPTMPLEFVACTDGGKDYESLVILKCKPWNIHLSLILAGLKEGKGPQSFGDPTRPTGDLVLVFISWEKEDGKDKRPITYRVEDLIIDAQTKQPLERVGWSFTGSMFVDDIDYDTGKPTGRKIYLAEAYKNIIASWHDPAAILNIPTRGGLYLPNAELLPPRGTKITLCLRPPDKMELEELKKINAQVAEREKKIEEQKKAPAREEK
ncbi:MAG: YdjY domain-containing protein [Planctomycetota bacterium]|nr:YdjY domain-containing protein [Planctomycetota bacterium]MDI6788529.1 YdjY domain-containing protein [Planctomycetota bacterium]